MTVYTQPAWNLRSQLLLKQVGELAKRMGFKQISLSSVVMPMVKMVPRGYTASADAYLTPHIMRYLQTFMAGFDDGLPNVQLAFMQSDGGLSPVETFSGHKASPAAARENQVSSGQSSKPVV